ncbi:hypothetical protein QOZ96_002469 [Brevundimonas nasdae]|uniref:hypothetical protein n=1 Tax=Brevundimonas nasdae TaxID=172043 RepID=UPI0019146133|nr:hypothetical protein [Brevundimonas nasdae]MBK6026037.1 hypothetical protein [Brevundimonas nasdae]MDQ0452516.1 hypothetical protein [Brevundimonas nasdae]
MFAKPLIALLLISPLVGACAGSTQVLAPTVGCSSLIPRGWTEPVPSAALPSSDAVEADWQVFGIEQTGQLARANGRTSDVVEIVTSCEARDAKAVRQIERPWWRRLWAG